MKWMTCDEGWYAGMAIPETATIAQIDAFERLVQRQFARARGMAADSGKHEYVDCPKGTGCPDCIGAHPSEGKPGSES